MVVKTIFMLTLFFVPLMVLASGMVTNVLMLFSMYILSGLGMAGIGMGVMHDAIHGSYSKNKNINTLLGYTFNLIGANSTVWKIQHNVLHHTYTNIDHADDDLNAPFFCDSHPMPNTIGCTNFSTFIFGFFMEYQLCPGLPQKILCASNAIETWVF